MPDDIYQEVIKIAEILKKGGIIIYPTDTVWGLGCDASNFEAVEKLYQIKKRDKSKSMLILVDSDHKIQRHIKDMPDVAWDIIDVADSPTTIIYDKGYNVAENLLAEDGSLGVRVCKDKFCQEIIKKLKWPLVSTSANYSGEPSPMSYTDIDKSLLEKVDYVVEYRRQEKIKAKPSAIFRLNNNGNIKILRK